MLIFWSFYSLKESWKNYSTVLNIDNNNNLKKRVHQLVVCVLSALRCFSFRKKTCGTRALEGLEMDEAKREAKINAYFSTIKQRNEIVAY